MTPPTVSNENIPERNKIQNIGMNTLNVSKPDVNSSKNMNKNVEETLQTDTEAKYLTSTCEPTSESEAPYSSMNEYYDETDNAYDLRGIFSLIKCKYRNN